MLTQDQETLEREFPRAATFVVAAELRREAYGLARGLVRDPVRNKWAEARLRELLAHAPACREPWFVEMVRRDGRQVEDLLSECGL